VCRAGLLTSLVPGPCFVVCAPPSANDESMKTTSWLVVAVAAVAAAVHARTSRVCRASLRLL
jgi:hypothetical protein